MDRFPVCGNGVFLGCVRDVFLDGGTDVGCQSSTFHSGEFMTDSGVEPESEGTEKRPFVGCAVIAGERIVGFDNPQRVVDVDRHVQMTCQTVARPSGKNAHVYRSAA